MAVYRVMVVHKWTDSLPKDDVVNTLHFLTNAALGDADQLDLVNDVANAFDAMTTLGARGFHVKLYDIADTKPRPILEEKIIAPTGAMNSTGNRDVACCLSFYSGRNLPRQRGRIYVGPFPAADAGALIPGAPVRAELAQLASDLGAAGPANCQWAIYSTMDTIARGVTNYWVDHEWDTQRRRGRKASARDTGAVTA